MNTRQPQQERSRTTRRRLIEAAVECLGELGWNGTTVMVIAQRAGVSRGAAQHHFPAREDLVTAAVEYLGEVQIAELHRHVADLPPGQSRLGPVVDMLLNLYAGPMFRAALQLWVELGLPGSVLLAAFAALLWLRLGHIDYPPLFVAALGGGLPAAMIAAFASYDIWHEWWIGALSLMLFLVCVMGGVCRDAARRDAVAAGNAPPLRV